MHDFALRCDMMSGCFRQKQRAGLQTIRQLYTVERVMSIQYRRLRRLSVFAAVALAAIFAAFAAQSSDLGERFSETIPCGVACDNAYTLFIGGDLLLAPDGQIEGRAAISGTLQLTGTGAFTSSVGGIGAAATGFNRSAEDLGENLVVAGDVIIDTGHALRVDGVTPDLRHRGRRRAGHRDAPGRQRRRGRQPVHFAHALLRPV
jgi:hypothetical protein